VRQCKNNNRPVIIGLVAGAALIIAAVLVYVFIGMSAEEPIDWNLTLIGKSGEQQVLSFEEIRDMPCEKARGGFFTTVGVVNGPYEVKGIPLVDLCALVGGVTPQDMVMVSAPDGYSMVFDYEQLNGDIQTYDAETLREVPHDELKVLLTYEQDGKTLPHNDGRPLRVAVVGNADLLTEGHNWVKWVDRIEVISLD
jgi:DMSO/TMAO reductase YedYZ molybdopterin-dependent catalytic subunit